jgi:hypothetical protein
LPNASVGHKSIFVVVIRYMKGRNWLNNFRVTRDQTAKVLLLSWNEKGKDTAHAQLFKVVQVVEYFTR